MLNLDEQTETNVSSIRKPRKSSPQSKLTRPTSNNNVPLILNLIDSLIEEKQFDHNDENLLGTIDSLITSLKHLKDKLRTIHDEETHPLNLSKPKIKPSTTRLTSTNHSEDKHVPTGFPSNFPLPTAIFPPQTYFSPYSSKFHFVFSLKFFTESLTLVNNMTHIQNYLKQSAAAAAAASLLNESMVNRHF